MENENCSTIDPRSDCHPESDAMETAFNYSDLQHYHITHKLGRNDSREIIHFNILQTHPCFVKLTEFDQGRGVSRGPDFYITI